MNRRKIADTIFGVLTLIIGLIFLLDACQVAFDGFLSKWDKVVLAFISTALLSEAIVMKKPIFYVIAGLFVGLLGLSASIFYGASFWVGICILLVCFGIGMIISNLVSRKGFILGSIGITIVMFFGLLLIGVFCNIWKYVLPAEIIVIGIVIIALAFAKGKSKKMKNDVYYVELSDDENIVDKSKKD